MSIELWISFIAAASLLCFTPGPTVLLVMGQAINHRKSSVLPLVGGVLCGDLIAMSLSFVGLGALLAVSSVLFAVVKWLGVFYLIYLGIKAWRSKTQIVSESDNNVLSTASVFRESLIVTALNPKGIVFFLAFFPLFITPASPALPQMLILGCTFLCVSAASASFYALFSSSLRQKVTSENFQRRFNKASGGLLIGAGALTASMQKQ